MTWRCKSLEAEAPLGNLAVGGLGAGQAQVPDGRRFSDILRDGGRTEVKPARDTQLTGNWLKGSANS